jgi:hypothetical protein
LGCATKCCLLISECSSLPLCSSGGGEVTLIHSAMNCMLPQGSLKGSPLSWVWVDS